MPRRIFSFTPGRSSMKWLQDHPGFRLGQMREQITIQAYTPTRDDIGQAVAAWTTWKSNVWASDDTIMGGELFESAELQGELIHFLIIRYIDGDTAHPGGVEPKMRVLLNGREYDIKGIIPMDHENRYLGLFCLERIQT